MQWRRPFTRAAHYIAKPVSTVLPERWHRYLLEKQTIDTKDPRIAYQDDRSRQYWDCCFASAREWEQRNMSFQGGYRRQVLLLHTDPVVVKSYAAEFKFDCDKNNELMALDDEWAEMFQKRTMWNRRSVTQRKLCFELDDWNVTQRLRP